MFGVFWSTTLIIVLISSNTCLLCLIYNAISSSSYQSRIFRYVVFVSTNVLLMTTNLQERLYLDQRICEDLKAQKGVECFISGPRIDEEIWYEIHVNNVIFRVCPWKWIVHDAWNVGIMCFLQRFHVEWHLLFRVGEVGLDYGVGMRCRCLWVPLKGAWRCTKKWSHFQISITHTKEAQLGDNQFFLSHNQL